MPSGIPRGQASPMHGPGSEGCMIPINATFSPVLWEELTSTLYVCADTSPLSSSVFSGQHKRKTVIVPTSFRMGHCADLNRRQIIAVRGLFHLSSVIHSFEFSMSKVVRWIVILFCITELLWQLCPQQLWSGATNNTSEPWLNSFPAVRLLHHFRLWGWFISLAKCENQHNVRFAGRGGESGGSWG
jgi:hypothetical protein